MNYTREPIEQSKLDAAVWKPLQLLPNTEINDLTVFHRITCKPVDTSAAAWTPLVVKEDL